MVIAILAILGLIFGSFINALVWRLHEREERGTEFSVLSKKKQKNQKDLDNLKTETRELSIWTGRSMCPHCHHALAAKDLVPVFSWLWLRGRCRYCRAPIGWQYPLVELVTAGLFVLINLSWPLGLQGVGLFQFVYSLLFIVFFVALAVYDFRWLLLPDKLVFPLVGLAAAEVAAVSIWLHDWQFAWQAMLGAVLLSGLFWVLFQISRGNWIGGGDVKLAMALGLIAGSPLRALMVLFLASLLGCVVSLPLLLKSRRNLQAHIPFGPFLLAATVVVILYGGSLVDAYTRLFF